jgi:sulfoxide reductase heme-binding subunit YedZ
MDRKIMIRNVKAVLFLVSLLPLVRLAWLAYTNDLGANPVEFIIRSLGTWTLVALLATLSLTPIRLLTGLAWPLQLRRMMGLFAFFYVCLHLLAYAGLDLWFDWLAIGKDIAKHPYVLVGFTAFILLVPLAATSTNVMIRRLGKYWKQLHQLVYLIAILGVVHYWWLVKKDIREPAAYGLVLMMLFAIRLYHKKLSRSLGIGSSTQATASTRSA